ncbi:MAG: desulfoferrodoxin family protein [Evtepia sp.]
MEFKLYKCSHCGNIAYKIIDSGATLTCCGEEMAEMKANVTDGAKEKHVPVLTQNGVDVTVAVGSVPHPMMENHYIPMIAAVNDNTVVIKLPKPGEEAVMKTQLEGKVTAYEWCNLHGLWMGE